jgi:hypothetical protein
MDAGLDVGRRIGLFKHVGAVVLSVGKSDAGGPTRRRRRLSTRPWSAT